MSRDAVEDHLGEWVRVEFEPRPVGTGGGQVGILTQAGVAGVMLQVNHPALWRSGAARLHFYPWHTIRFVEFEGMWDMGCPIGRVGNVARDTPTEGEGGVRG